ncbi:hypothetical protein ACH5RR_001756 [Cinchona calisaya]|uniref:Cupin type-1 domain-containing protein n=1 Tax=Cinchona calisaya TaxID=153742 RepID=A0ABD3B4D5_9GENT
MSAFDRFLFVIFMVFLTISFNEVLASDPDMLQDICVADLTGKPKVNGFICKENATAYDFFTTVLGTPGATNNKQGSAVTAANVMQIPGLNTLGVSLARIDYAPDGLNPPHTHPRATEIVFVLEGELDKNNGKVPAAVIAAFNSQLPGTQAIAVTLFTSTPPVPDNVLAKAFQISIEEVKKIESNLAPKK